MSASGDQTIKLWDTAKWQCLQTFDMGSILNTLLLDTTGSYLHTDIGTILLDTSLSANTTSIKSLPRSPKQLSYTGYSVSPDGAWITWNSDKLIWLPPEYRPVHSAVAESANRTRLFVWPGINLPVLGRTVRFLLRSLYGR